MTIIGPNGNDVFAVSITFRDSKNASMWSFASMTEAISEEEAIGIATKIGRTITSKYKNVEVFSIRVSDKIVNKEYDLDLEGALKKEDVY